MMMHFQVLVFTGLILAGLTNCLVRTPFRPEHLEPNLAGQVAVVTGASRGLGKGMALALAEAGAKVYVTGRTLRNESDEGSLEETCRLIRETGGHCIPMAVDSTDDEALRNLMDDVLKENRRFDILVNNAFSGVNFMARDAGRPFWEKGIEAWDLVNQVGLRSHYVAAVIGTQLMRHLQFGLIVNVGSFGGLNYGMDVAYGVGKAAMDRMANDMAIELRTTRLTMVSLWPGLVQTENMREARIFEKLKEGRGLRPGSPSMNFSELFDSPLAETPLFVGRTVAALARDRTRKTFSGQVLMPAVMAYGYGILDERGVRSPPWSSLKFAASWFFMPLLKFYGLWQVPEQLYAKHPPVSDLMNFYWNYLPDLVVPGWVLKLDAGAPNL